MIRNYIKIAWRSLNRNKSVFVINVLGLAIGIASCLMIAFFVVDELSFDRFFRNSDSIARVVLHAKMGDELIDEAGVMAPVGRVFDAELDEVEGFTRLYKLANETKVTVEDKTIRNGQMMLADSSFFQLFSLTLVSGDPITALEKPYSLVLTEEQSKKYFGNDDALGKTIDIQDIGVYGNEGYQDLAGTYTVTGIMKQLPANSHFHFDLLGSMNTNPLAMHESWLSGQFYTYIKLRPGTDITKLEKKSQILSERYIGPQLQSDMGVTYKEFVEKGNKVGLFLQPLEDIHLYSSLRGEIEQGGNPKTVAIFSSIALLMLLIACANYMNLATAAAMKRTKEIGMRKVLGSEKKQLIFQFMSEAVIAVVFATIIGIVIFYLAMPYFNNVVGKNLSPTGIFRPIYLISILGMMVFLSFFSGAYPSFFMSGFKPLSALKNKLSGGSHVNVRSGLVIFQFAVSAILIFGTVVVNKQMKYILGKDVGYDRASLIVIRDAGYLGDKLKLYKELLQKDSRVKSITTSAFVPAGPTDSNMGSILKSDDPNQRIRMQEYQVDEEYIPTLGMKLIKGRNFDQQFGDEKGNIIINETAISSFGLPQDPIGFTIKQAISEGEPQLLTVVGVIKDFHTRSLREPIQALVMKYNPYYGLIIKSENEDMAALIKTMKAQWDAFGTGETFSYALLDELYNDTYLQESNTLTTLMAFTLLTIFVACLGLFGLITFTTEQRIKEIGIRKTLGSSVSQIVVLLSKHFIKLIGIAMVIAFPLAYYVMNYWLQDYEFRINIQTSYFVFTGLLIFVIGFATISFKSIKAALVNPVNSLRD